MKNVFTGPLGQRILRRAKSISQKRIEKILTRNKNKIDFVIDDYPNEILFYKYNPERSGDEKFLGRRIVA